MVSDVASRAKWNDIEVGSFDEYWAWKEFREHSIGSLEDLGVPFDDPEVMLKMRAVVAAEYLRNFDPLVLNYMILVSQIVLDRARQDNNLTTAQLEKLQGKDIHMTQETFDMMNLGARVGAMIAISEQCKLLLSHKISLDVQKKIDRATQELKAEYATYWANYQKTAPAEN